MIEPALALAQRLAKGVDWRADRLRYHRLHAKEADSAYAAMCRGEPGLRLDPGAERRIRTYAKEVLGSRWYAPWLRVYAAWAGEFREGWIPDNYFGRVVLGSSGAGGARVSGFKTLSRRLLQTDLLPDVAYFVRGGWFDLEGRHVASDDVRELLFSSRSRIVAKFDGSSRGRGVVVVDRDDADLESLEARGDFVVQEYIRQSPFFDAWSPGSVATIRITTVRSRSEHPETRAAYLRLGRAGDGTVLAVSSVRVPIIDTIGTLGDIAALPDWTRIRCHPDTGEEFGGRVLPSFERACREVERLHSRIPHALLVGWDVAVTGDGEVRLMEWNGGHAGMVFTEASVGPSFSGLGWERLWRPEA